MKEAAKKSLRSRTNMLPALLSLAFLAVGFGQGGSDPCDSGYTWNGSECVTSTCSSGTCTESCPSYTFERSCVDKCPVSAQYAYGTECYSSCPSNTITSGDKCIDRCPSGTYNHNGVCVDNCPAFIDTTTMKCVDSCPTETTLNGNRCERPQTPTCQPNQYLDSTNTCQDIPSCSSTQYLGADNRCYESSSNSCSSNQYLDSTNTCQDIPSCSSTQYLGSDNRCYDYPSRCNSTQYMNSNGTCVDYHTNPCSTDQYMNSNGTCVEYPSNPCPSTHYMGSDGKCHSYTSDCETGKVIYNETCYDKCPREAPFNFYGKCLMKCPEGMWEKDGQCTYECPHYWNNMTCVERCPPSTFIINEKYCYDDCPIGFQRDGQHCDMTNYTYPCTGMQVLNSDGDCVDHSYNYTNPCGTDQWMMNNTCVPACKEGEFMDMNGNCMNPADMCQRGLPGGIYNYDTNTCECPEGHWIQRDDSFVPPVTCSRIPTSILTPHPRFNCHSFIPYTVYKPELDNCVCDADHPVIVPNPKDTFLSFSCAALGTATTIRPCDGGLYFDFMRGKCVTVKPTYTPVPNPSYTPMPSACPAGTAMLDGKCQRQVSPSPSMCPRGTVMVEGDCKKLESQTSSATMTAMPSRRPSLTPSSTRTPKPSDRPGSPTSTTSASRTPRPSGAMYMDVSRKPLPSVKPLPPPVVEKSPAPSPWAKKTDFVLEPEEKPAYIEAKVSVAGGNATEMTKPEKIQEMQASLACTLRMPLENILITSVTYVDEKGSSKVLDIDTTKFMMAGDGSTDCYDMKKPMNSTQGRSLRALQMQTQQEQKGAIEVNYAIISPSDDILAMDTTQMQQVISTSPIMIQAATSVGGTKLTATSIEFLRSQISPSSSPTATASGFLVNIRAAIGGGVGAFALFVGIVIGLFMYSNDKKRSARMINKQTEREREETNNAPKSVMVVFQEGQQHQQMHMNPIQNNMNTRIASARFDASPETTRRSAEPLKSTHSNTDWTTRNKNIGTSV